MEQRACSGETRSLQRLQAWLGRDEEKRREEKKNKRVVLYNLTDLPCLYVSFRDSSVLILFFS